jgi:CRISPR-associated protein Cmr1
MSRKNVPAPPGLADLPRALAESRSKTHIQTLKLTLKIVTPVLGGGYRARQLDDVDVVRVGGIRGQLRFWWRALYGHECPDAEALFDRESKLWGGVATDATRSAVKVSVSVASGGMKDASEPSLQGNGGYALWPARSAGTNPTAQRRKDTTFKLNLDYPSAADDEIKATVRAFVQFGGIGSRTRRGLGTLLATDDTTAAIVGSIEAIDRREAGGARTFPSLRGARLVVGERTDTAMKAWEFAVGKLQKFRQGIGTSPATARNKGQGTPPGRSRWPEPDVIRDATNQRAPAHARLYAGPRAYPRGQFGLPIVGRFGGGGDPTAFTVVGRIGTRSLDRLASPLIVKAMQVEGGFVPAFLWLRRADPKGLEVGLDKRPQSFVAASAWPTGEGSMFFAPLSTGTSMREVFMNWLVQEGFRSVP